MFLKFRRLILKFLQRRIKKKAKINQEILPTPNYNISETSFSVRIDPKFWAVVKK